MFPDLTTEQLMIVLATYYIYTVLAICVAILAFSIIGDAITAFKRWRAKRTASRE